jgi:5'-methylthioadenosine phosphorylase
MRVGIIGGSGLSESEIKKNSISLNTPFGSPSSAYEVEYIDNKEVLSLRRHGERHSIPPHKVNYKANIWGFKELSVEAIFGVFAVGSFYEDIPPGTIVIPDQIIDFTQGMRDNTFYDGPKVVHIDFTNPFCDKARHYLIKTANNLGIEIVKRGTYICINGPRLETAAEIKFFRSIGGEIIGMTIMPEASLARELALCYSAVCVVVNYAAGISKNSLTVKEVLETMNNSSEIVKLLVKETIKNLPDERMCSCKDALKNASF